MTAPSPTEERRGLLAAAGLFFGALVVLLVVAFVFAGDGGDERTPATLSTSPCAPDDAACEAARASGERPGIIPKPGEGQAPRQPGDRGGWEQLALLGVIVVALGSIAAVVVRSTRRARARGADEATGTDEGVEGEAAADPTAAGEPR